MRASALWIGYVSAVLTATPAHAEAIDDLELGNIEDVETLALGDLLEQEVTSASRYAQKPADSPTLVSTVDRDLIDRFGYRTLTEALTGLRGLYTTNDRNYSYLGARGFSVPGDYNSRFSLTIDNHRINDPVYGQATPGAELGLPMIAVERVELVRGGAWSVHGQNALLGAVQVVTASGATRPGVHVMAAASATAETFHDPAGRPAVAPRAQDVSASYGVVEHGVDVFIAGQYSHDLGLSAIYMPELAVTDEPCIGPTGQPRACDGVVIGNDGEEVISAFAVIRGKHLVLRGMAASRRKRAPTAAFATVIGGALETFDERAFADLEYSRTGKHTDLVARVAVDRYHYHGTYPIGYPVEDEAAAPGTVDVIDNLDLAKSTWWSSELRGRYKRPKLGAHLTDFELAAGAEAGTASGRQANGDQLPDGYSPYFDRTDGERTLALGGHVKVRAYDHVVGFAALRADYHPDSFGLAVNPQGGLVLDGGELGRIRASIARGYRAPNLYEQYYGAGITGGPSVALDAETSETRELSIERYLTEHMRVLVVGFHQDVGNLISLTGDDDGTAIFRNQGEQSSHGLEAELEARWDRLRLRASMSRQRARDGDGLVPANSPRSLASFSLLAPIADGRVDLGVESFYVGSRLAFDREALAPVFKTNLVATVHRVVDQLDLTLGINNLFDERSADPGSEEHRQSAIPNDPRTVWVRLALALEP
ncbi:MAG: TonB-dependent receptor [Kofleriaceae bacterium]